MGFTLETLNLNSPLLQCVSLFSYETRGTASKIKNKFKLKLNYKFNVKILPSLLSLTLNLELTDQLDWPTNQRDPRIFRPYVPPHFQVLGTGIVLPRVHIGARKGTQTLLRKQLALS